MDEPHARLEEDSGILKVTLSRPKKLNAISPQVTELLWTAIRRFSESTHLRCMIIAAEGKYFTAGYDLASAPDFQLADDPQPGWTFRRFYRQHHLLYDEFEATEKPIILVAQGDCLGAGLEMAVSCDFRFCSPRAHFALPEVRLGVLPGSGGISRLTRLVGPHWGKYLAMAGKKIDAQAAKSIGLVHDIFDEATLLEEAVAFCKELMTISAETLGLAKMCIDLAADIPDRAAQRNIDRIANTTLMFTGELRGRTERFRKDG